MRVEKEEVLSLIDALARIKNLPPEQRLLFWPCPRCGAAVDAPCCQPGGFPARRIHAPRADLMINAFNSALLEAWRADMEAFGDPPAKVLRRLKSCKLYRYLAKTGRLEAS
jgi:hypothetical protein